MEFPRVRSLPSEGNFDVSERQSIQEISVATEEVKFLLENVLLENYIMTRFIDRMGIDRDLAAQIERKESDTPRMAKTRSTASNISTTTKTVLLTDEQKCAVVKQEADDFQKQLENLRLTYEATQQEYAARMEEANIVAKETEINRNHFDRNVTTLLTDLQKGAPIDVEKKRTDAFIRFHRGYIKRLDAIENNLRMENVNLLKTLGRNMKTLRSVEESGTPGVADIKKKRVRCIEGLEKLYSITRKCGRCKLVLVKAVRSMRLAHTEMEQALQESQKLTRESKRKKSLNISVNSNVARTKKKFEEECRTRDRTQFLFKNYVAPSRAMYMNKEFESSALTQQNITMQRKLYLAKLNLERHKILWMKVKSSLK